MTTATSTTTDLAGTWTPDGVHSNVSFIVKHMMVARVRGTFQDWDADIVIGEDPADSRVRAVFRTESIDTGQEFRDKHLRSGDFFDSETHPEMVFESRSVEQISDVKARLEGDLTIRGVTRPVTLDVTLEGQIPDAEGGLRSAFFASTTINRKDWGLTWNQRLESGDVLVGDEVRIEIEIAAVRK